MLDDDNLVSLSESHLVVNILTGFDSFVLLLCRKLFTGMLMFAFILSTVCQSCHMRKKVWESYLVNSGEYLVRI